MQYFASSFDKIKREILSGNLKALLFHGTESADISLFLERFVNFTDFSMREVEFKFLLSYGHFSGVFSNLNLFEEKEIIKVVNTPSKVPLELVNFITRCEFFHFPIFISSSLSSSSTLKKLFISERSLGVIGFYKQESIDIGFVKEVLHGCKISNDAISIIVDSFPKNTLRLKAELEKLKILKNKEDVIEAEDVLNLSCTLSIESIDLLFFYLIRKEAREYFSLLEKSFLSFANPMLMLKTDRKSVV